MLSDTKQISLGVVEELMQMLMQAVGGSVQKLRVSLYGTVLLAASIWSTPAYATCGDAVVDGNESCDDGDTVVGDGCNRSCQVEAGYVCTGAPSLCCFRDAAAAYNLLGSATTDPDTGEVTLTPDEDNKVGFAWYRQPISFARDFSVKLKLYLGTHDGSGADGGSIIFQRSDSGISAVGRPGGFLGASFSPLIGVEFDDWLNVPGFGDIPEDHTSIFQNSVANQLTSPVCMNVECRNVEDGQYHEYQVSWNTATNTLVVLIEGLQRLSLHKDIARDVFSGDPDNIIFGFSASTGTNSNLQKFCPAAPAGFAVPRDQDGDGVDDSLDVDDDNDGILDTVEVFGVFQTDDPSGEHDADGVSNWHDADYWRDVLHHADQCPDIGPPIGECDSLPTSVDADGDGFPNHLDLDSDNDRVKDVVEVRGADANDDGKQDGCTPVAANGGCGNAGLLPQDFDGNGTPDVLDNDSDYDGDGKLDREDPAPKDPCAPDDTILLCASGDADHDGILSAFECTTPSSCEDSDRDGTPDFLDDDSDNDATPDALDNARTDPCSPNAKAPACPTGDTDGDGVPNFSDPKPSDRCEPDATAPACPRSPASGGGGDSGNMSPTDPCLLVTDALECPNGDTDGDGVPNADDSAPTDPCIPDNKVLRCGSGDADDDGMDNQAECPMLQSCMDNDGDGVPDYLDVDDTGNTPAVAEENRSEDPYADGDGLTYEEECPGDVCPDTDQDGMSDDLDDDDDGDGVLTAREVVDEGMYGKDVDHDGHVNHLDTDADNDGLRDGKEAGDANGNGVPDYLEQRFIDDDGCSVTGSRNPIASWWFFGIFGWILKRRSSLPKPQS